MKVRELESIATKNGWVQKKTRGPHKTFKKDNRTLIIPHPKSKGNINKYTAKGIEKAILEEA